jgi:CO/xanthine dehydrogenase Mo-binding subunit
MVATDRPLNVVGTRPVRPDGVDKVTGRAQYGADVRFPGMLYGRILRSPHAHAIIKSIDTSKAEALPGVRAAVTNADFPRQPDEVVPIGELSANLREMLDQVLADDKALYRGHAIVALAATDPHIAEDALDLIEVDYEVLDAVLDAQDAMRAGAPQLHPGMVTAEVGGLFDAGTGEAGTEETNAANHVQFSKGDVEAGFADADVVIEREFDTAMYHQGYIEPHNGTAMWNADNRVQVWSSTQGQFEVRDQTAILCGLAPSRVTVEPVEIGGGFGGKTHVFMEPIAAMLSKKTGRPVKMIMTRQEVFEGTGPTSGTHNRVKIGAKRDGTITAMDAELIFEAGGYPGSPFTAGAMCAFGPYDVDNIAVEGWDVVVNKPKVGAYRAPGAPAAEYAVESVIDELAERLEMDPLELRLKNAAQEGTVRADGAAFGVIGNVESLRAIQQSEHYRSELSGEHRGRGVASGFWFNVGFHSAAHANVNSDGTVSLVLGSADIGGTRASLAMQFAETLGIPYESVNPQVVNTDSVGYTMVTGGSRTAFAGGWAAHEAALDIRRQLEERAAAIWECERDQVSYEDGVVRGPDGKQFTFVEMCEQLPTTGGLIQGQADVSPDTSGPAFACHVVDVEVDPETGKVEILRYTAAQDVGRAVHPSYVESQMQGGVSQGVGMALHEEYVFNDGGTMENPTLLDYRMPTSFDLPMIDTILVEVPNPGHPYGVRGVGEIPIVPALAAVANAIHDATGVRVTRLPATPDRMLEQLEEQGG